LPHPHTGIDTLRGDVDELLACSDFQLTFVAILGVLTFEIHKFTGDAIARKAAALAVDDI
jgi:hypothetical protein